MYYTLKIPKAAAKGLLKLAIVFYPVVGLVLWSASPWWALVWLLLLAF